jgi:uncharacterized damage-inducible protein DinB
MAGKDDRVMREQLVELLKGGSAHLTFDKAVADLPADLRGAKPAGQPHTPWRLLEHMRIAQRDILDFCQNPKYVAPRWPDEYWPATDAPPAPAAWDKSVKQFRKDLRAMQDLVSDLAARLFAPIPHGQGQTIFREAMLVADHNAYHLGQLVLLRRLLGAWED